MRRHVRDRLDNEAYRARTDNINKKKKPKQKRRANERTKEGEEKMREGGRWKESLSRSPRARLTFLRGVDSINHERFARACTAIVRMKHYSGFVVSFAVKSSIFFRLPLPEFLGGRFHSESGVTPPTSLNSSDFSLVQSELSAPNCRVNVSTRNSRVNPVRSIGNVFTRID